jgi:hypothetical protein
LTVLFGSRNDPLRRVAAQASGQRCFSIPFNWILCKPVATITETLAGVLEVCGYAVDPPDLVDETFLVQL